MANTDWKPKFDELFSELDNLWNLEIVSNIVKEPGWLRTQYKGTATFECSAITCKNRWTSVNAGAIFYYHFSERHGKVKLFLGGQKCKKCDNVFEPAQWHDSKVAEAITKVLNKVKQKFYDSNAILGTSTTENAYIPGNRAGPHKTTFCQLCEKGVCEYNKKNNINRIAKGLEDLNLSD